MTSGLVRLLAATVLAVSLADTAPAAAQAIAGANDAGRDRELAWSAWNAGRDRDAGAASWLELMVSERIDTAPWSPPVDFALDALIQLNARLAPELLGRIAAKRPAEALVLLAREEDAGDTVLLDILSRERGDAWFAAANLLLPRKPPGIAARLLAGLRVQTWLTISDDGLTSSGGGGGSIGCGITGSALGMPPWPSYTFTSERASDDVLFADGPQPVSIRRTVQPAGEPPYRGGSFSGGPDGDDRLRYLAEVAGPQMLLHGSESHGMAWHPNLDLDAARADLRRDITERHAALVRDLVVAGWVSADDAAALTVQVDIDVVDLHGR